MLNTSANMTALEWFFRRPPASDIPQNTASPELRQLCSAIEQLATACEAATELAELHGASFFFVTWITKISSTDRVERNELKSLVTEIDEVIGKIKNLTQSPNVQNIEEHLNATVISLALLAKTSQDIDFRREIIRLAKHQSSSKDACLSECATLPSQHGSGNVEAPLSDPA